jgi:repressor LexA
MRQKNMLTKKQTEAYRFIKQYIAIHGYSPKQEEIAVGLGIRSTGVVHRYVTALVDAGYLALTPNKRRNIQLVNLSEDTSANDAVHGLGRLPLFGAIAAGQPIEALNEGGEDGFLDFRQVLGDDRFALKVQGDSMLGDNICDGDYVICEACDAVANGDIAVVLVDREEATLKRVQRNTGGTVSLIPSNPAMDAMVYEAGRVSIQGRYLGLLRL